MIAALLGSLLGGWKKWVAVAGVVAAVLGVFAYQRVVMANRAAEIARIESTVAQATAALGQCKATNDRNLATLHRMQADRDAAIAAITADRDRLVAEARAVKTIRGKIHEQAPQCVGVPSALKSVADWLHDNPAERR